VDPVDPAPDSDPALVKKKFLPELVALSLALGQAALVARIADLEVHVAAPDNRASIFSILCDKKKPVANPDQHRFNSSGSGLGF
jgi:hypothetical protein